MKKLLIFVLLLASAGAQANGDPMMCAQLGNIYATAVKARDTGNSPEDTLKFISGATAVTLEMRKKVVNQVFFEPGLANISPDKLQAMIFKSCYYQAKPFEPLR